MFQILRFRLCLLFFPVLLWGWERGLEASESPPSQGRISGVVLDRAGEFLSDVFVTLENPGSPRRLTTQTDLEGRFDLDIGKVVRFVMAFEREGFRSTKRDFRMDQSGHLEIEIIMLSLSEAVVQERIMVIGEASAAARLPGSAHYLDRQEGSPQVFDDVHKLLREVPGVNLREEEGFGLRPNIGMRGTGSERSSKITMMEDGVLIAPAPYSAPAAYYFPVMGRMKAVEIRKGSSQIKYGPRSTGGALNLVSKDIPRGFEVDGDLAVSKNTTGRARLAIGSSTPRFGWLLETYQLSTDGFKQLDGGGDTGARIGDYLGKMRFNSSTSASVYQQLELKVGMTSQESNETYLGLTDEDFGRNPLRRYSASRLDRFDSKHEQVQITYLVAPFRRVDITTTAYRNQFHRNWYKLQSVEGTGISEVLEDPGDFVNELAILKGAESQADALAVRANNRRYYSQGIQSVIGVQLDSAVSKHLLEVGIRYHQDQEDRFQHEDGFRMTRGRMVRTRAGAPGSQSNRLGDATALAVFAQDTLQRGRLSVMPGIRFEKIRLVRTDFSGTDPDRTRPTGIRENEVSALIPGLGFRFDWRTDLSLFGGLHKGFSPPSPGSSEATEFESSLNYEAGLGWTGRGLELQGLGFFNDYANLLGTDTLSSGGSGEGGLFNGGRARVWGAELSGSTDLAGSRLGGIRLPLRFAYTLTEGRFLENFDSDFEPWGSVSAGDHMPYLARHQLFVGLSLQAPRWRLHLDSSLVGRMRTVAGQGPVPTSESTDAPLLFGLSGEYDLMSEKRAVTLFVTVQNLTNQAYIAARRPAGARPGLPRMLMGGIKFHLGR